MQKDPYYCLSCNNRGEADGIISILTPCDRCGSLLILPMAQVRIIEVEWLMHSMPALIAEESQYRKWRGKKHLRVVPNDALAVPNNGSAVSKNVTDDGGNETA